MTILIGFVANKRHILASDTRMLVNDEEVNTVSKIVEFPSFLVGSAGNYKARSILYKLLNRKKVPKIKDYFSAVKFQDLFFKEHKEADIDLLVVTKNGKIFHIDKETVVEYTDRGWHTVGSGAAYAKPIINLSYPNKNCIVEAIQAASQFSASCNSEVVIKEI